MGYTNSTVHGIPVPNSAEPNNIPEDIGFVVSALEGGSIIRRLTQAQIDALTAPQKPSGVFFWNTTTNRLQYSNGSTVVDYDSSPIGAVIMFGGTVAPSGWHLCDGSAHGSSALQAVIGSANTPDLRDRFVVGAGSSYAVGNTGGAASVTLTAAQSGLPLHSHNVNDPGHIHSQKVANTGAGSATRNDYDSEGPGIPYPQGVVTDASTTGITLGNAGPSDASTPHENRPPYYALTYIIKKS